MKDNTLDLIRISKSSVLSRLIYQGFSPPNVIEYAQNIEKQKEKPIIQDVGSAKQELNDCASLNITPITIESKNYPTDLKNIQNPPIVLYAKGNLNLLSNPKFAIVGARASTIESRKIAEKFAQGLSEFGFTITSGFAFGVDTASCVGALKYGTIQVLGSGVNIVYPRENTELYKKVLDNNGLFLAELPPNSPIKPENFPLRNRIISGLSKGVLLVQASRRNGSSGSLITAKIALEQEKDLFAIPGHPTDVRFEGGNHLIKYGNAIFTTSIDDITDMIGYHINKREKIYTFNPKNLNLLQDLKPVSTIQKQEGLVAKILDILGSNPVSMDEISVQTCEDIENVQVAITELELLDKVQKHRDGRFSLNLI
jgi:DNA processing protein